MDIEFSIKSTEFFEFLCVFDPAVAAVHSSKFCGTGYIKVNISYELDDNKNVELNQFKISKDTEEKNVPEFINLPLELQKMMVEKSSSKSYIPFLGNICVNENIGGFKWGETEEGYKFWSDIINYKNFEIFFERYPKKSLTKTDSKVTSNLIARDFITCGTETVNNYIDSFKAASVVVDNCINYTANKEVFDKLNEITELLTKNNESDENQLQGEKVPFRGTDPRPGRVLRGSNKTRVTIKSLSYKKVIGRG